jgi:hypothetical protein
MEHNAAQEPGRVYVRDRGSLFVLLAGLLLIMAGGCRALPRALSEEELHTYVAQRATALEEDAAMAEAQTLRRALRKIDTAGSDGEATLDYLVLSGGGEYGAFGAGFLRGWGEVIDPACARPDFDVVTGISTGALIAPFALLGNSDSYARVERLYREASPEFAILRGLFFFLPKRPAFFDNRALRQAVEQEVAQDLVRQLLAAHARDKVLLIGTTDLDVGRFHVWNVGKALTAETEDRDTRLENILLASSAIPAAFPPIEIDGRLYVDGGASEQLFLGVGASGLDTLSQGLHEAAPGATLRLRVWVVVNQVLFMDPEVVPNRWTSIATRSLTSMMKQSTLDALRRMADLGRLVEAAHKNLRFEFRYVAIPQNTDLPKSSTMFQPETMKTLADLGYTLGRDPGAWRTAAPAYHTEENVPQMPEAGELLDQADGPAGVPAH